MRQPGCIDPYSEARDLRSTRDRCDTVTRASHCMQVKQRNMVKGKCLSTDSRADYTSMPSKQIILTVCPERSASEQTSVIFQPPRNLASGGWIRQVYAPTRERPSQSSKSVAYSYSRPFRSRDFHHTPQPPSSTRCPLDPIILTDTSKCLAMSPSRSAVRLSLREKYGEDMHLSIHAMRKQTRIPAVSREAIHRCNLPTRQPAVGRDALSSRTKQWRYKTWRGRIRKSVESRSNTRALNARAAG